MSTRRRLALLVVIAAAMLFATVGSAFAAGYDMSLTLPTYGKSGCMVCHGDPNLVRIKGGKIVSLYLDQKALDHGAHAKIMCTACHTDFGYAIPHNASADWQSVAKSACQTCHKKEWTDLANSVHGSGAVPGTRKTKAPKPLCGDCHGSHFIPVASKDPVAKARLHASASAICGRCHPDYWKNYDDYYHGAAYRKGANDAPACWDCHGAHGVLPSTDRSSPTNKDNLVATCGKCHQGASVAYTQYATLIHRKDQVLAANPVYAALRQTGVTIGDAVSGFFGQLRTMFEAQQARAQTR